MRDIISTTKLAIVSRCDAGKLLADCAWDVVCCIHDIGTKAPRGFQECDAPFKIHLEFEDFRKGQPDGPQVKYVRAIKDLGSDVFGMRMLFSCEMGISRSSAAALIYIEYVTGLPELARQMVKAVEEQRRGHKMIPNQEMLRLAGSEVEW